MTAFWLDSQQFEVHNSINIGWAAVAGVYIFVRVNAQGNYVPLYVGQTTSFAARLPGHERWAEAVRLGATQVHAKVVQDANQRTRLEVALIRRFNPVLNKQHTA